MRRVGGAAADALGRERVDGEDVGGEGGRRRSHEGERELEPLGRGEGNVRQRAPEERGGLLGLHPEKPLAARRVEVRERLRPRVREGEQRRARHERRRREQTAARPAAPKEGGNGREEEGRRRDAPGRIRERREVEGGEEEERSRHGGPREHAQERPDREPDADPRRGHGRPVEGIGEEHRREQPREGRESAGGGAVKAPGDTPCEGEAREREERGRQAQEQDRRVGLREEDERGEPVEKAIASGAEETELPGEPREESGRQGRDAREVLLELGGDDALPREELLRLEGRIPEPQREEGRGGGERRGGGDRGGAWVRDVARVDGRGERAGGDGEDERGAGDVRPRTEGGRRKRDAPGEERGGREGGDRRRASAEPPHEQREPREEESGTAGGGARGEEAEAGVLPIHGTSVAAGAPSSAGRDLIPLQ